MIFSSCRTFLKAAPLFFLLLAAAHAPAQAGGAPGRFDYWALVLSWSPTYCSSPSGRRDRRQCGPGRSYAFVAHGLWPQFERGWPANCARRPKWVSRDVLAAMIDIMPSHSLIIHEWKKHGTCSGLEPERYFSLTRSLFRRLVIPRRLRRPNRHVLTSPQNLKKAFLAANPRLRANMISVQCGNRRDRARLREIRICFSRDLTPRPCGRNERRECRARVLVLPPSRQGAS